VENEICQNVRMRNSPVVEWHSSSALLPFMVNKTVNTQHRLHYWRPMYFSA